jgi:hypothetical protein
MLLNTGVKWLKSTKVATKTTPIPKRITPITTKLTCNENQLTRNASQKIGLTPLVHSGISALFPTQSVIVANKVIPKVDSTALVYLDNPPQHTEEDKDAAAYLGVNHFYRGPNNYFYMVQFEPSNNPSFENYIELVKLSFYGRAPYGTISEVTLSPELLKNFEHLLETKDIQCRTFFFDKSRIPKDVQRVAEVLIVIMTPGGFWMISCHGTYFQITANKDQMIGNILKNLHVELKKPENPIYQEVIQNLQKQRENEKLPAKGKKLPTQKAFAGSVNLTTKKTEDLNEID